MERWNPKSNVYYLVFGPDGEFFSIMEDFSAAWLMAKGIDGWLGDVVFAKPKDLQESFGAEVGQQIQNALDGSTNVVRRGKLTRKPDNSDIHGDGSPES